MTHKIYLITRWNAPCFPTRRDLAERRLDESWLRERLRLFGKYCYPSVVNQSFQDFKFICWMHPDSPQWLRNELLQFERAHFVYDDSYNNSIDFSYDVLVTTRLDNDDMLHRDFMQNVRMHLDFFNAVSCDRMLYSFTNGYRYIEETNELLKVIMPNSPFLTLFADIREQRGDWSVYCGNHGTLSEKFDTIYNRTLSAWSWTKHSTNTASISTKPNGIARASKILPEFGVKPNE